VSNSQKAPLKQWRVAAIQMVSGADVDRNLAEAEAQIAAAATQGAQMVALPEYFPLLSADDTAKVAIRETDGEGPLQQFLSDTAKRYQLWLVGGTVPLSAQAPDKVRNSTLVYAPDGERVARYDKMHLFGYSNERESYDESRTMEAGPAVTVFDSPFGRVGLSVCYDLRFPEFYRCMGEVSIILVPSAFTAVTGAAHWEVLLRARAIENQCFVIAPAQGGSHPGGRETWGHSMIIDPWGGIMGCREESGAGVVVADIEADRMRVIRESLPALRHRRID
jgi:deaminated glutathione amidase